MPEDFTFRIAGEEDVMAARMLYMAAFNKYISEDDWYRKYFLDPWGKSVSFAAIREGEVVSFYSIHPYLFRFFGKEQILYQGADSMTDSKYRRMGLTKRLKAMCDQYLADKNILIEYMFPNWLTYSTRKMSYFHVVGNMTTWMKPLHGNRTGIKGVFMDLLSLISKSVLRVNLAEMVDVGSEFDASIDRVWFKIKDHVNIASYRSSNFLSWRYSGRQNFFILMDNKENPSGYLVVEKTNNGFWIRDLQVLKTDTRTFFNLIQGLVHLAKSCNSSHIGFSYLGTLYNKLLFESGFFPYPVKKPFAIYTLSKTGHQKEWLTKKNWFMCDADKDWQLDC